MSGLASFRSFTNTLEHQETPMPVLFVGHGSPMNGIQDNEFSSRWSRMGKEIPTPQAVLVISAHWLSQGSRITAMDSPRTIHDFGGFPPELSAVQYPAPGDPVLAERTAELIRSTRVLPDHDWGLDHGTWSIVRHMYPKANIPVLQLSLDQGKDAQYHFDLARDLMALRRKGVLIIGSGNMVHNLRMLSWEHIDQPGYGYDWTLRMNELFKKHIETGDFRQLIRFRELGREAELAIPTPEHFIPLLYTLALKKDAEEIAFFNDKAVAGSLTMTSVKIG